MTAREKPYNGFDALAGNVHPHLSAPYLSVVAASRNDEHGGDLSRRTQIFVDSLVDHANRQRLPIELVLVEWNPPSDRPPLEEELRWPAANEWCEIRIVTVPSEIHRRFPYAKALPMFQMMAKNAGVRRAKGQFVLQTNIDIVFSEPLFKWIARRELKPAVLYRCDRVDVDRNVPIGTMLDDVLHYCATHVLRIAKHDGMWIVPAGNVPATVNDARHRSDLAEPDLAKPDLAEPVLVDPVLAERSNTKSSAPKSLALSARIDNRAREVLSNVHKKQAVLLLHGKIFLARLVGLGYESLVVCAFVLVASARALSMLIQMVVAPLVRRIARRIARLLRLNRLQALIGQSRLYRLLRYRLPEAFTAVRSCGYTPTITLITDYLLAPNRTTPPLHTYACGDFMLTDMRSWEQMRGTPELPVFSMNLDSLALVTAYKVGITPTNLPSDHVIYHIDHGDGWTPNQQFQLYKRLNKRGVPIISYWTYLRHAENILNDSSHFLSDENWGLSEATLREKIVSRRATPAVSSLCITQEWMESATSTNMLLDELGASAAAVNPPGHASISIASEK